MVLQPSIYYAREQEDGTTFMVMRLYDRASAKYVYQAGYVSLTDFDHTAASRGAKPITRLALRWDSFAAVDPNAAIARGLQRVPSLAPTRDPETDQNLAEIPRFLPAPRV